MVTQSPKNGEIEFFAAILRLFVPNPLQFVHVDIAFHAMLNPASPFVVAKGLFIG